jgi:hypothetical protein
LSGSGRVLRANVRYRTIDGHTAYSGSPDSYYYR